MLLCLKLNRRESVNQQGGGGGLSAIPYSAMSVYTNVHLSQILTFLVGFHQYNFFK